MKLVDVTICGAVLVVAGVMALAPRQRAEPTASPEATLLAQPAPDGTSASALRSPRERRARALDAETVRRCLEVMRDIDPQRADALERLSARQSESALAESLADKHYLRSLAALKGQNPRLYQMRIEELRLDGNIDLLKN